MKTPITYNIKELTEIIKLNPVSPREINELEKLRPRTRAECIGGPRPCPWARCKYHLYLDVSPKGSLIVNFPDLEIWEMEESCALDVAEIERTLEIVGSLFNLTRERIRQIQDNGLTKLARNYTMQEWGLGYLSTKEKLTFIRNLLTKKKRKKQKGQDIHKKIRSWLFSNRSFITRFQIQQRHNNPIVVAYNEAGPVENQPEMILSDELSSIIYEIYGPLFDI